MKHNIKLIIEFDGTNYCGWQVQPHSISIQQTIEEALFAIYNKKIKVIGCGRTDAGVHAENYVLNFNLQNNKIPLLQLPNALNFRLPHDIVVKKAEIVSIDFHARYSAVKKTYRYTIFNNKLPSAFNRNQNLHIPYKLDIDKMKKTAKILKGEHNFKAFCTEAHTKNNFVRTIYALKIEKEKKYILIDITADGFLYNMARTIVGTLIKAGQNKLSNEDINNILKNKDRKLAGPTAPAKGLCLLKVNYS